MATVTASTPLLGVGGAFAGLQASGTFIPTLWSSKLNAKFYTASTFADICNTNWEGEISGMGDKIVINNIPDIAISTYVPGAGLTYQVPTPSTLELQIDKGKYFAFQVNDIIAHQAQPSLMDMFSNDASMQMKVAVDSECFYGTFRGAAAANQGANAGVKSGAYNLGTEAAPVTLTGANILQTLTALAGVLDEQNIPETERALIMDPVTRQILMQSNLAQAQFMGDSQSMIRNGKIGAIDRFTAYVSNNMPRTNATQAYWTSGDGTQIATAAAGTADRRRVLIACHKSAISFASQMTKLETVRNPNDFGDFVRGVNVYGYKVTKPEAMAIAIVK